MIRAAYRWSAVEGQFDGSRPPGVYVVDADNLRRLATVRLLTARTDLRIVGDHRGSPGFLVDVVRALPHVCVVGARVVDGQPPQLIEELERALPASRCVRAPKVVGTNRATLSPAGRLRLDADLDTFVDRVLRAAGLPAASVTSR